MNQQLAALAEQLAVLYPLEKVSKDFFAAARADFDQLTDGEIHFYDGVGRLHKVPDDCTLEIVTRVMQIDLYPASTQVRIVVAVGGIRSERNGIVLAHHFLAKAYYSEGELFSMDIDI